LEAQELREQLAKAQEESKAQADLAAAAVVEQAQTTLPKGNVTGGAAADTGAIPISRSLDVSAAMNKPGFKRPRRRAAKPSATPAVENAAVNLEEVHVSVEDKAADDVATKPVVADSVETYIQEEIELQSPVEVPKSNEPEPVMAADDHTAENTVESSIKADTGKFAAQPILVASPKHMAKYEHSPHSGTDHKYQRSP
jgi:hypothetical protein